MEAEAADLREIFLLKLLTSIDDGEIDLLMCRDEIHDAIIKCNKATLSQCKEFSMYQGSLAEKLHP